MSRARKICKRQETFQLHIFIILMRRLQMNLLHFTYINLVYILFHIIHFNDVEKRSGVT